MRVLNRLLLVILAGLAGCEPSTTAEPSGAKAQSTSFVPYVVKRADGLQIEVLAPGDGPAIAQTSRVTLHYAAYVPGEVKPFDTTRESGIPATLDFAGRTGAAPIQGLERGLVGLQRGARAKLTIPPELAWSADSRPGGVPEGSAVVYSVEILEVQ